MRPDSGEFAKQQEIPPIIRISRNAFIVYFELKRNTLPKKSIRYVKKFCVA
jgi:hypothetical protein